MKSLLLGLLLLTACGSTTAPSSRAPKLGTYTFASTLVGDGTLRLTYATPDSVAGTWNVAYNSGTMTGPTTLGFWNSDAYLVYGRMQWVIGGIPTSTQYAVRFAVSGAGMSCTAQVVGDASTLRACALTWTAP